jgi:uncharacterized membrane protein
LLCHVDYKNIELYLAMDIKEEEEIKKEFQLERVILFSDAVFAIIITIMVLDVKLPEGLRGASHEKIIEAIIEVLPKLAGYALAFFITGMFWSKHIKLFSYLKDYTKQLITYNLFFLFFISLFPFGVSVMAGTLSPRNYDGFYVYFSIVMMALLTQTALIGYLVRNADELCIKPKELEKNLEWKAQRVNYIAIPVLIVFVIISTYNSFSPNVITFFFLCWAGVLGLIRKKLYPETVKDGPLIARLFKSVRKQKKTY